VNGAVIMTKARNVSVEDLGLPSQATATSLAHLRVAGSGRARGDPPGAGADQLEPDPYRGVAGHHAPDAYTFWKRTRIAVPEKIAEG